MSDVLQLAGGKVIEDYYPVLTPQEFLDQMRADEPSPAGDDYRLCLHVGETVLSISVMLMNLYPCDRVLCVHNYIS